MVFKFGCLSVVIVIFLVGGYFFVTEAKVVPKENEENEDNGKNWNYNITPHNVPLLQESTKPHQLPPIHHYLAVEDANHTNKTVPRMPKQLGDAVRSKVSCGACKIGVGLLMKEVRKGSTFEEIQTKFVTLCTALKIESEQICTGIFDKYGPVLLPAANTTNLEPLQVCSLVLGEVCGPVENPQHDWKIKLLETKKPNVTEPEIPKIGLPTFKVLQISDTHYDPEYEVGSHSNCDEPLCCRKDSNLTQGEQSVPAGRWGAYKKCDSPKMLIDHMLKHIAEQHPDIDYILWTGDLPPHDIWRQTKESNLGIIHDTVQQMFETFPRTPIFPAIGNHESVPAGNFAPPWITSDEYSIAWLYREVADQWRKWLPNESGNTVLHGAFYSVLLRPGFRLISLNTNYCHSLSWWLLVNSTDPAEELKWLVHELQEAEDKNEKVHIIGHIPPGSSDCMKQWSENFYKIVNRYENTIMAQFYGHSHADEFELFYEPDEYSKKIEQLKKFEYKRFRWREKLKFAKNKFKTFKIAGRATSMAYLGPSVTTFENYNPAYRIYYVDGDHAESTREVLDHETWTMDLEEANKGTNEPKWYRLYSAKDAYNMKSLRPKEWSKFIETLVSDEEMYKKFYRYYYRDSPTRPQCDDDKCKLQLLCDLKSAKSQQRHTLCHDLELTFGQ